MPLEVPLRIQERNQVDRRVARTQGQQDEEFHQTEPDEVHVYLHSRRCPMWVAAEYPGTILPTSGPVVATRAIAASPKPRHLNFLLLIQAISKPGGQRTHQNSIRTSA